MSGASESAESERMTRETHPVETTAVRIPIEKIVEGANDPSRLSTAIPREQVKRMAQSFKSVGQLQPIGVRPIEGTDTYRMEFGRRRLQAARALQWPSIDAVVLQGMTDRQAKMAAVLENLHRTPLNSVERYAALRLWSEFYEEETANRRMERPAKDRIRANLSLPAPGNERSESQGNGDAPAATTAMVVTEKKPLAKAKALSQQTGQSESASKRDLRIARSFTDDQLKILTSKKVPKEDMDAMAAVTDDAERGRVVNNVAAGMTAKQALRTIAAEQAADADRPKIEEEMNDQEWTEFHCHTLRERLGDNTKAFDKACAYYRRVREELASFKKKVGVTTRAFTAAKPVPQIVWLAHTLLTVAHPRDWLLCADCQGTGGVDNPARGELAVAVCPRCKGDGFRIRTEKQQ